MRNYEREQAYKRGLYAANRAWVDAFKLAAGCADCGLRHKESSVYDFDHVRGRKLFNVGGFSSRTLKQVKAEIKKCDVVCANCHRVRTADRKRT